MKIFYSVTQDEGAHVIEIVPENPLNGFMGTKLVVKDAPDVDPDAYIAERVVWKMTQELGQTYQECQLVKV
jgi:hypothetical protein